MSLPIHLLHKGKRYKIGNIMLPAKLHRRIVTGKIQLVFGFRKKGDEITIDSVTLQPPYYPNKGIPTKERKKKRG